MSQKVTTRVGAGQTILSPTMNIIEVDTSEGAVELIMPTTSEIRRILGTMPISFTISDITGNAATNNITIKPSINSSEVLNGATSQVINTNNGGATLKPIYGIGYFVDILGSSGGGGGSNGFKVFNFNYENLQPDDTTTKFLPIENVAAGNYTVETFYQEVHAAGGVDGIVQLSLKSPEDGTNLSLIYGVGGGGTLMSGTGYVLTEQTSLGVEVSLLKSSGVINDLNAGEWNIYYRITEIAS